MAKLKDMIRLETHTGTPRQVGDVSITPQSQALAVLGKQWGYVWNRPVAVMVEQGGEMRRMPVVDVTRWVVWGLYLLAFLFTIKALMSSKKRRVENGESND